MILKNTFLYYNILDAKITIKLEVLFLLLIVNIRTNISLLSIIYNKK